MSTVYRTWLPRNAILDKTLEEKCVNIANDWSEKWLTGQPHISVSIQTTAAKKNVLTGVAVWQNSNQSITAILSHSGQYSIAETMLGFNIPREKVSQRDSMLLDKLVAKCIGDLHEGFTKLFSLSDFITRVDSKSVTLNADIDNYTLAFMLGPKEPLLEFYVSSHLMAAARKSDIKSIVTTAKLGNRNSAIEKQMVSLGALVGRSKINISDLKELSSGDVLILDADVGSPLNMTLNHHIVSDMVCELGQNGKDINLNIKQIE